MRKAKQDNWRYSIVDIEQDALEASEGSLDKEDIFYCWPCGTVCCPRSRVCKYPFQVVNWFAVFGHFCSFVLMIYFYMQLSEPFTIPYTETYIKWNRLKNVTGNETCAPSLGRINSTDPAEDFCIGVTTGNIADSGVDLGLLIIAFHVLSFVFQGLAGLSECCKDGVGLGFGFGAILGFQVDTYRFRYTTEISKGRNLLRFVEYSFSASIMLVAIALLNGVTDINLIACIAVLTAATQIAGLVCEYLLAKGEDFLIAWVMHVIGWMQFLCAYGVIMHAFLRSATQDETIQPPWFVFVIVWSIFAFYGSFGMVQVTELLCYKNSCCSYFNRYRSCRVDQRINYQCKEMAYVILSLASKLVLGWLIFTNFLIRSEDAW